MVSRDKVRGCFIGVAVGDALGMPVETFSYERIREEYGKITQLHAPTGHKWFDGEPAGSFTDDTQLTLAVARGMLMTPNDPLNMNCQAVTHVAALKENAKGWGASTKNSIRRLANGVHWERSGESDGKWSGRGNGVPMKIAPLGLYLETFINNPQFIFSFAAKLSLMTHRTSIAVSAAFAQIVGVALCANWNPAEFSHEGFCECVTAASRLGRNMLPETLDDDLTARLETLREYDGDTGKMIADFGAGSCYCYHSVPFSLAHFLKNPTSIDCLYDVVSAGGDTDSNGSMVGALLGALNGESIFPSELVQGVVGIDKVMELADKFYDFLASSSAQQSPKNAEKDS